MTDEHNENDLIILDLDSLADDGPEVEHDLVPTNDEVEPEGYGEHFDHEGADDEAFDPTEFEADTSGEQVAETNLRLEGGSRRASRVAAAGEVDVILRALGWRIRSSGERTQAVRNFQRGWALGATLTVDGKVGPATTAALRLSYARLRARKPTASAHFSFTEFRCKCGGKYSGCARIWITRRQVVDMEKYRSAVGHGLGIVSGCRCIGHNKAVGGASASRHMAGDACDFADEKPASWFRSRGIFKGLGFNRSNNKVRHGDQGGVRTWVYA